MTRDAAITEILQALQREQGAFDDFVPVVYDELRLLARSQIRRLRPGDPIDTTELVHEAYLKLAKKDPRWHNRRHFFATAAKVMRHLLVDAARASGTRKRGGDAVHVSVEEDDLVLEAEAERILAIDRVLKELAQRLPRLSQVVELRFFGGLTEEEAAGVLDISTRTLRRDWIKARAWLNRRLGADGS